MWRWTEQKQQLKGQPRLVMTLGNEVAAFLRGDASAREAQPHLYGHAVKMDCFGWTARVVHCAHPGLFTRGDRSNAWSERHQRWCSTIGTAEVAAAAEESYRESTEAPPTSGNGASGIYGRP